MFRQSLPLAAISHYRRFYERGAKESDGGEQGRRYHLGRYGVPRRKSPGGYPRCPPWLAAQRQKIRGRYYFQFVGRQADCQAESRGRSDQALGHESVFAEGLRFAMAPSDSRLQKSPGWPRMLSSRNVFACGIYGAASACCRRWCCWEGAGE